MEKLHGFLSSSVANCNCENYTGYFQTAMWKITFMDSQLWNKFSESLLLPITGIVDKVFIDNTQKVLRASQMNQFFR